jgi:hypothetical protein
VALKLHVNLYICYFNYLYKLYSFLWWGRNIVVLIPMIHSFIFSGCHNFFMSNKYFSIYFTKFIFTLLCGVEFLSSIINTMHCDLSFLTGMDRGINCSTSTCFYPFKVTQRKICDCNFRKRWLSNAREKC